MLFADDAILIAQNPQSLQSLLNDISKYCIEWGLRINIKKTKIMIFELGRPTHYDFYFNGTKIDEVESFKYLGLHIFKNNNWLRSQKHLASQASRAMHNLFTVYNQLDLPTSQKIKLFDSLVAPILNYSSEIWGNIEAKDIEAVHLKCCRKILYVRKSTNLDAIYGELGRTPMKVRPQIHMLKYWSKLCSCDRNSLLYKTYSMLYNDVNINETI